MILFLLCSPQVLMPLGEFLSTYLEGEQQLQQQQQQQQQVAYLAQHKLFDQVRFLSPQHLPDPSPLSPSTTHTLHLFHPPPHPHSPSTSPSTSLTLHLTHHLIHPPSHPHAPSTSLSIPPTLTLPDPCSQGGHLHTRILRPGH
jgi:hypothetical protein